MKHLRRLRCWATGHTWTNRRFEEFWSAWVYDCPRCDRVQMRWFE